MHVNAMQHKLTYQGGLKMQTIKLPDQDIPMNFKQARLTAVGKADEILKKP